MAASKGCKNKTFLNQIFGDYVNKKFELKGSKVIIGRAPCANIKLEHLSVSRKHCILTQTDSGWEIQDNKSQNGTYVSGKKLDPDIAVPLGCGDIIFLGPPRELPQAFCVEIDYDWNDSPPDGLDSQTETTHKADEETQEHDKRISTENNEVINNSVEVINQSAELIDVSTPVGVSSANSTTRTLTKLQDCKNRRIIELSTCAFNNDSGIRKIVSTECSSDIKNSYKRKLEMPSHTEHVSCSKRDELKKSKTNPIEDKVPRTQIFNESSVSNDQSMEVSSTGGGDESDASESLLDDNNEGDRAQPCQSTTESETELLKLKLAALAKELKRVKKEKSLIVKQYKEKNEELTEKIAAEKQKLKTDLENCEIKAKDMIKKEIMVNLEEDLLCNICTELLIKPTVLDCHHTFCEYCIYEWKKKKNECPNCRSKIHSTTRVLTLEHFIDKTLQTLTPEQKDKRESLIRQRNEAKQQTIKKPAPKYSPRRSRRGRRNYHSRSPIQQNAQANNFVTIPLATLPTTRAVSGTAAPLHAVIHPSTPSRHIPTIPLVRVNGYFMNDRYLQVPEILLSEDESEQNTVNIFVN